MMSEVQGFEKLLDTPEIHRLVLGVGIGYGL
jgi:hypothetical protein